MLVCIYMVCMMPCAQFAIDIEKVILSDWGDTGSENLKTVAYLPA